MGGGRQLGDESHPKGHGNEDYGITALPPGMCEWGNPETERAVEDIGETYDRTEGQRIDQNGNGY